MRRFLLTMALMGCICTACLAGSKKGYLQFEGTTHSFGTFSQRTVRTCVFVFKNTGQAPVVISAANVTCHCTSPQYPKHPIFPGKKGYITVYYDGRHYSKGHFRKNIDVLSDAENGLVRLFISGTTR